MRQTFEEWMKKVEQYVGSLCGLSADDLDDYGYADAYDDGRTPKSVARSAIRNAGGNFV